jgi:hypothetical protein
MLHELQFLPNIGAGTLAVIGSSFPLILVAIPPLGYFYYLIMQ